MDVFKSRVVRIRPSSWPSRQPARTLARKGKRRQIRNILIRAVAGSRGRSFQPHAREASSLDLPQTLGLRAKTSGRATPRSHGAPMHLLAAGPKLCGAGEQLAGKHRAKARRRPSRDGRFKPAVGGELRPRMDKGRATKADVAVVPPAVCQNQDAQFPSARPDPRTGQGSRRASSRSMQHSCSRV